MRVLVTGAGGLLGGRLASLLAARHAVVAAQHVAAPPPGLATVSLDLRSADALGRAVDEARPDAVVHAAAFADADACEREPERAEQLNVRASEVLARRCRAGGVRLIAISTDLVLDGTRAPSREQDPAQPLMTYGRTKLAGEEAVLAEAPGSVVLRVALVHGLGHGRRGSASEAIAWALGAGRPLRLLTDQYRTPIDPESVAAAIERLLEGSASGRFHLGGPERLSRHALGLRVARLLRLRAELISPLAQDALPLDAPRPADASLDSGRARRELGWAPRALDLGVGEGRTWPD